MTTTPNDAVIVRRDGAAIEIIGSDASLSDATVRAGRMQRRAFEQAARVRQPAPTIWAAPRAALAPRIAEASDALD